MRGKQRFIVLQSLVDVESGESTGNYLVDRYVEFEAMTLLDSYGSTDPGVSNVGRDVMVQVFETPQCHTGLIERALLTHDESLLSTSEYILRLGVDFAHDWPDESPTEPA